MVEALVVEEVEVEVEEYIVVEEDIARNGSNTMKKFVKLELSTKMAE